MYSEMIDIEKIANSLKTVKELEVIEPFYHDISFAKYINVKDEHNNSFSVLIFQIDDDDNDETHSNQFLQKWRQTKLDQLKEKAIRLQSFNHEHFAICFDSFQIESCFYIQIERIQSNMLDWVNQHHHNHKRCPLSKRMFINIVLQMLETVQYLHKQKCILHHESILQSFMIDSNNQIKLFHFDFPEKVEVSMYQKLFLYQLENTEQFYYHPMLLDLNNRKYIYNYNIADIFSLAICFLQLNGISYMNILEFIQKKQISVLPLESLGYDLVSIIIPMLLSSEEVYLPSVSCLIQQFKNAENALIEISKENIVQRFNDFVKDQSYECQLEGKQQQEDKDQDQQQSPQKVNDMKRYVLNFTSAIFALVKNDFQIAQDLFLECLKDFPNNDFTYIYLGQTDNENAKSYFDKALEINQQNDVAYIVKRVLEVEAQKYINCCEKAIEISCNNNDDYYQILGIQYQKNNDQNKSCQFFQNVLNINECCVETLLLLGDNAKSQGKHQECQEYYLRAIEINPNGCSPYLRLGRIYLKTSQFDKSIECYEKYLQLNHEEVDERVYLTLANLFQNRQEYSKAIQILTLAIQKNINSARIYRLLASLQSLINLEQDAIHSYRKALKIDPTDDLSFNNMGILYSNKHWELEAIECYKKSIELKADETVVNLSCSYLILQQYEKIINKQNNKKYQGDRYRVRVIKSKRKI